MARSTYILICAASPLDKTELTPRSIYTDRFLIFLTYQLISLPALSPLVLARLLLSTIAYTPCQYPHFIPESLDNGTQPKIYMKAPVKQRRGSKHRSTIRIIPKENIARFHLSKTTFIIEQVSKGHLRSMNNNWSKQ